MIIITNKNQQTSNCSWTTGWTIQWKGCGLNKFLKMAAKTLGWGSTPRPPESSTDAFTTRLSSTCPFLCYIHFYFSNKIYSNMQREAWKVTWDVKKYSKQKRKRHESVAYKLYVYNNCFKLCSTTILNSKKLI